MKRHRHRLGKPLGFIVDPAWANRVHIPPVRFRLGVHEGITVDLRCAGKNKSRTFRSCQPQHFMRPHSPDLHRGNRKLHIVLRTGRRGKMHDGIQRPLNMKIVAHVVFNEGKPVVPKQMGNVLHPSRQEVVHADDGMSAVQQQIGEMTPEEPSSTCNKDTHTMTPLLHVSYHESHTHFQKA